MRVSLPLVAAAQRMEVTVEEGAESDSETNHMFARRTFVANIAVCMMYNAMYCGASTKQARCRMLFSIESYLGCVQMHAGVLLKSYSTSLSLESLYAL